LRLWLRFAAGLNDSTTPELPLGLDGSGKLACVPKDSTTRPHGIDLFWIPLGADAHVVRVSGRLYEALAASIRHRPRCDLYHSALEVRVPEARYVIEQAPIPDDDGNRRGVVAEGPVGFKMLGRFRLFRYEIRCWRDGTIPDLRQAVGSPVHLTDDIDQARRVLDLLPSIPTPVWGRDDFRTGEMWNSNSVVSWVLANSGIPLASVRPPSGGRAPGWHAGIVIGERSATNAQLPPGTPRDPGIMRVAADPLGTD
jgi:hypothetical protein